jgi:hypothetical protein
MVKSFGKCSLCNGQLAWWDVKPLVQEMTVKIERGSSSSSSSSAPSEEEVALSKYGTKLRVLVQKLG